MYSAWASLVDNLITFWLDALMAPSDSTTPREVHYTVTVQCSRSQSQMLPCIGGVGMGRNWDYFKSSLILGLDHPILYISAKISTECIWWAIIMLYNNSTQSMLWRASSDFLHRILEVNYLPVTCNFSLPYISQATPNLEYICTVRSCSGTSPMGGNMPRAISDSRFIQYTLHVVS